MIEIPFTGDCTLERLRWGGLPDIRRILAENCIRDALTAQDRAFLQYVAMASPDPELRDMAGGITREMLQESLDLLPRMPPPPILLRPDDFA